MRRNRNNRGLSPIIETIYDNGFRNALKKAKIPKGQLDKLFSEYDAAPEDAQQHLKF